jgi:hypothetical protein
MDLLGKSLRPERNKAHQEAKRTREEGSAFEVYFAASPRPPDQPVVIFHHIQKTAGTSLRQIIHRNYVGAGARHMVFGAPRGYDPVVMREWTARFLNSLNVDERDSIVCVAAHGANHLMRQMDGPARAITFLRDPVDRIMSRYFFGDSPKFSLADFYKGFQDPGHKTKSSHLRQYCNAQSRSLLEPFAGIELPELGWSRGAPDDARLWRERLFSLLADSYTVGLQDRFEESVICFGGKCGWTDLFVPHAKTNKTRPREVDEELRAMILEYNWLDQELYEHFACRPIGARSS